MLFLGWTFHEGVTSPGHDIQTLPLLANNIVSLLTFANSVSGCVCFTTAGALKNKVLPPHRWTPLPSSVTKNQRAGLFVKKGCHNFLFLQAVTSPFTFSHTPSVQSLFANNTISYHVNANKNCNILAELTREKPKAIARKSKPLATRSSSPLRPSPSLH